MAGAGYKLFNTGDVLTAAQVNTYLMEQTVMRFATTTARDTALSGVLAEGMICYIDADNNLYKYTGSAWVNIDSGSTSPLTTKGDIYTYSTTDARLAVGANGDTLVADSSATTGLRWQADFAAGKNAIINGDFRIWQRGTSISLTNNTTAYTTDRWYVYTSFSAGSSSLSQQTFTPGTAPVAGYEGFYFARFTAGSTATYFELGQRIEDVRVFAGQTATLSFWAKASTNTTLSSTLLQNFGSGGSSQVSVSGASHSVTTSWTRFTATISVPSISGKTVGTSSYLAFTLAANSLTGSQTIDIWGVQLEPGSVATGFETATGTLAGELQAAQRYYWRSSATSTINTAHYGMGIAYATTGVLANIVNPVPMRVAPTSVDFSSVSAQDGVNSLTASNVTLSTNRTNQLVSACDVVVTGATQFRPYHINSGGQTTGFIGFSAEL